MVGGVTFKTYVWLCELRAEVASGVVWEQPSATLDLEVRLTTNGTVGVGFFRDADEREYEDGIVQSLHRDSGLNGPKPIAREDEHGVPRRDGRLFGCFHEPDTKKVKDHRMRASAYNWGLWEMYTADLDPITVETSSDVATEKLLAEPEHRTECVNLLADTTGMLVPQRSELVLLLGAYVEKGSRLPEYREVFDRFIEGEPNTIWRCSSGGGLQKRITNAQNILGMQQDMSEIWSRAAQV